MLSHLNQYELSRRWAVSPRTLERWRCQKKGPAYLKIEGRVIYRLYDIEEFEARSQHNSLNPADPMRTPRHGS